MANKSGIATNQGKELCFDFHIHSKFSYDSLLSPKRIVRIAEKRGLDGIAITDHNTIRGALEASKFNKSLINVDLIETLNGRLSPELNIKAQTLARNTGLPIIGGSDAHMSKSIGAVRTF